MKESRQARFPRRPVGSRGDRFKSPPLPSRSPRRPRGPGGFVVSVSLRDDGEGIAQEEPYELRLAACAGAGKDLLELGANGLLGAAELRGGLLDAQALADERGDASLRAGEPIAVKAIGFEPNTDRSVRNPKDPASATLRVRAPPCAPAVFALAFALDRRALRSDRRRAPHPTKLR